MLLFGTTVRIGAFDQWTAFPKPMGALYPVLVQTLSIQVIPGRLGPFYG